MRVFKKRILTVNHWILGMFDRSYKLTYLQKLKEFKKLKKSNKFFNELKKYNELIKLKKLDNLNKLEIFKKPELSKKIPLNFSKFIESVFNKITLELELRYRKFKKKEILTPIPISPWKGIRLGLNMLLKNTKNRIDKKKRLRKNKFLYNILDELWDTQNNNSLTCKNVVEFTTYVLDNSENYRSTKLFPVRLSKRIVVPTILEKKNFLIKKINVVVNSKNKSNKKKKYTKKDRREAGFKYGYYLNKFINYRFRSNHILKYAPGYVSNRNLNIKTKTKNLLKQKIWKERIEFHKNQIENWKKKISKIAESYIYLRWGNKIYILSKNLFNYYKKQSYNLPNISKKKIILIGKVTKNKKIKFQKIKCNKDYLEKIKQTTNKKYKPFRLLSPKEILRLKLKEKKIYLIPNKNAKLYDKNFNRYFLRFASKPIMNLYTKRVNNLLKGVKPFTHFNKSKNKSVNDLFLDLITRLKKRLTRLEKASTHLKKTSTRLKKPVTRLKKRVTSLKKTVTHLKKPATRLKKRVTHLKKRVTRLKKPVTHLKKRVTRLKKTSTRLKKPVIHFMKPFTDYEKKITAFKKRFIGFKKRLTGFKKPLTNFKKPRYHIKKRFKKKFGYFNKRTKQFIHFKKPLTKFQKRFPPLLEPFLYFSEPFNYLNTSELRLRRIFPYFVTNNLDRSKLLLKKRRYSKYEKETLIKNTPSLLKKGKKYKKKMKFSRNYLKNLNKKNSLKCTSNRKRHIHLKNLQKNNEKISASYFNKKNIKKNTFSTKYANLLKNVLLESLKKYLKNKEIISFKAKRQKEKMYKSCTNILDSFILNIFCHRNKLNKINKLCKTKNKIYKSKNKINKKVKNNINININKNNNINNKNNKNNKKNFKNKIFSFLKKKNEHGLLKKNFFIKKKI